VTEPVKKNFTAELLEILVCPVGLAKLELAGDRLVCTRCGTRFRIEAGGIPNMHISEAELPPGVATCEGLPCFAERERKRAAAGRRTENG
jgi:uncharacterized protein YbaR (Trm112 family)